MIPRCNVFALMLFGPILIGAGLLGFVLPERHSLMSGAPAYNLFHLAFGTLGTAVAFSHKARASAAFNLGFGAFDLYQAAAGILGIFPAALFALRPADHVVHVVVGVPLCVLGALGLTARP